MDAPDLRRIARRAEAWFARHRRPLPWRETYDPYQVWVSEVMLQQTRMEVVLPYFERFMARFPTVSRLAAATGDEVAAAWSGLGYYRRAAMLRAAAAEVVTRFGGVVPDTTEALRSLPGVGRYTAGAIASVAWNRREAIVDGNVARIVARLFAIESALGTPALAREAWSRAEALVGACGTPRNFNQALMEIGALICRPRNPSCEACPLRGDCAAFAAGRTGELPHPKTRASQTSLTIALFVITDSRGRVLMQRASGPLMHGMLHLPHGNRGLLDGEPFAAEKKQRLGAFHHTVTTRRIAFEVWSATAKGRLSDRGEALWVDPAKLHEHPHPSYVRKALAVAGLAPRQGQ